MNVLERNFPFHIEILKRFLILYVFRLQSGMASQKLIGFWRIRFRRKKKLNVKYYLGLECQKHKLITIFFYFRLIFGCFCSFWHFTRFSTKFEVNKFDVGMSSEIEFNHIFKNQYANPLFRVIIISNGTGMRHMFQNEYLNNSTRIKREISIRFLIELFELKMHFVKR